MPYEDVVFDPQAAFGLLVSFDPQQRPVKKVTLDAWAAPDPFMGEPVKTDIDFDVPLQAADAGPDPFRRSGGAGRFQLGHAHIPATEKYERFER